MSLAYVNGSLLAESEAALSVFDHGLVVGDGAFETVLLSGGRPFALCRHLDRLAKSVEGLGLTPPDRGTIEDAVDSVVATTGFDEGRIRITVTAGQGPLGSGRHDVPLTLVVAASPAVDHHDVSSVSCVPWRRNERGALAGLKTISYAENAVALAYAAKRGSDEAIFANCADNLCEGSGSNVFVVVDGDLVTPPLSSGCLAGITRALVLEGIGAVERDLPFAEFTPDRVTEAFLTSAIRGVQPIATIDGRALGEAPGPMTRKAMASRDHLMAVGVS
jgi:branched-chain amino acid aminotransferase